MRFAIWAAFALALGVSGCGSFSESYQRGYVLPEGALEQIPVGASQDQVLIVLGTPSTVATVSGEAFYYISQKTERSVAFMPREVKDQRVVAVYFDKNRKVERLANYGIRDGKIFDYVSRTTQTAVKSCIISPICSKSSATEPASRIGTKKPRDRNRGAFHARRSPVAQCASTASSSSATMFVILIIGLTAGPAVSL